MPITLRLANNLRFVAYQLGHARRETHSGIEYLIAPATAIIEGVLNGCLVPAQVIEASIPLWPDVPVPLPHPTKNGLFVSAKSPEWTTTTPARFYNPRFEDGALKGEIWINLNQARALGGDAWEMVERIEAGQLIECSTGYFAEEVASAGIWKGEQYSFITTAIYPDHLAVLLHEVGACSIEDGCGVLANAEGGPMSKLILKPNQPRPAPAQQPPATNAAPCPETPLTQGEQTVTVNLELSLTDQDSLVWNAWWSQGGVGRIIAVYADRVDVINLEGLWAYPYTIDQETGAVEFGEAQQYQLTANQESFFSHLLTNVIRTFRADKEVQVKDQLIAKITANKRNKLTKEQLTAMDEPTLKALSESLEEAAPEATPPAPVPPPAPQPATEEAPAWATALIQKVDAQGQQITQLAGQLSANAAVARQPLVDFITANTELYTAEMLAGMETEGLEKIYQLVAQATGKQAEPIVPNFIGLGGRLGVNSAASEIAKPPSLIEAIQKQRNGAAVN
jgi:hypothetical protein